MYSKADLVALAACKYNSHKGVPTAHKPPSPMSTRSVSPITVKGKNLLRSPPRIPMHASDDEERDKRRDRLTSDRLLRFLSRSNCNSPALPTVPEDSPIDDCGDDDDSESATLTHQAEGLSSASDEDTQEHCTTRDTIPASQSPVYHSICRDSMHSDGFDSRSATPLDKKGSCIMRDILADVLYERKSDDNGHNYDLTGSGADGAVSLTGSIAIVPVYNTNNQPSPRLTIKASGDEKKARRDSASDDALFEDISWRPITTNTTTTEAIVNSNTCKDTRSPHLISRKSPIRPDEVLSENDTTWASSAYMVNNGGGYRLSSSTGSGNGRKSITQAKRERLSIESCRSISCITRNIERTQLKKHTTRTGAGNKRGSVHNTTNSTRKHTVVKAVYFPWSIFTGHRGGGGGGGAKKKGM